MTEKIHEAIIYAGIRHNGTVRKGTDNVPYLVHPMEVMGILIENGATEDEIVAGILHDVVEDTCDDNDIIRVIVRDEIEEKFGADVRKLVWIESEDKSLSWKERKTATIEALADESRSAQLVCCADKLSNILSMYADKRKVGDKLWKRFNADKENIRWYYDSIWEHLTKLEEDLLMKKQLREYIDKVFE